MYVANRRRRRCRDKNMYNVQVMDVSPSLYKRLLKCLCHASDHCLCLLEDALQLVDVCGELST